MPTNLQKQNVYKHSADKKEISIYCCQAFTLFEKSFRKIRQLYLTDQAIYIISRKKLKLRIPLNSITKVYIGILAGEFFIVNSTKAIIIDCAQGRSKFIQSIKQISALCQIEYVNYTTLEFLFERHKIINSKVKMTEYDSNEKKVMLRVFHGEKLNLRELRAKWEEKVAKQMNVVQKKEKHFQLTQLILSNTYWNIFSSKHTTTKKQFTIKIYCKKFIGIQQLLLTSILNQRRYLQNISTSFTPSLVKAFYSQSNIYLVCEEFSGCLLQEVKMIKKHKVVNLLAQIVIAVGLLHQAGLVYGGISKNGIMISLDGFVFLFNLGLSVQKGKQAQPQNNLKPPEYQSSKCAQFGWDWWNFGQLIFEIIQKEHFYEGKSAQQIQAYQTDLTDKPPSWVSPWKWQRDEDLYNLFLCLIKKTPTQRLGYKNDYHEILHHKYFEQWLKQHSKSSIMRKQCPPVFKKVEKQAYDQAKSQSIQKEFISEQDWSEMDGYLKDFQYSRDVE